MEMRRQDFLEEAARCVCGGRSQRYGEPENNFKKIAKLWTDYKGDTTFTAKDVAMMMTLLKIARASHQDATLDTFVDIAGYAACAGEIESLEKEREQNDN